MDDRYSVLRLKNQLCFPLYAVSNLIIRKYKPLLNELDLTYTQYIVMIVLWEEKQVNEKFLCESLCLKSNTLTPLLKKLEAMYRDLRGKGFEILDFPCNQFANQAPGSEDEIHEFCTLKFGTEFPQFAKIDVNGENADPLFAFLASEKPFESFGNGLKNAFLKKFADANNKKFGDKAYIKWNFTKFLIDREGKVKARFEPSVDMDEVRKAVEIELG